MKRKWKWSANKERVGWTREKRRESNKKEKGGSQQERKEKKKSYRERERNKKGDFPGVPTVGTRRSKNKSSSTHCELRVGTKILEFRQTL